VRVGGGEPKRLTDNPAEDHVPCFSGDGRWIYFSSTRSGRRQIYRIPAEGGPAVQITRDGGYAAAATDGKWLYYVKDVNFALWKVLAEGGQEAMVFDARLRTPLDFAAARSGIYFIERTPDPARSLLEIYRWSDGKVQELAPFEKAPSLQMGVSPDEKWLLFTRLDSQVNDLMLVENFR
jgi:Tol biopolymer transport system component